MSNSISLCMIVKNEEQLLGNCLKSVKDIADEMIVVDTGSEDQTVAIAESYQAKVIHSSWQNDFALARNKGVEEAKGDWILFLDADEELDQQSIEDLKKWSAYEDAEAYFLKVHNHMGPKGGEASINPTIRMFRNKVGYRFTGKIHEQIADSIQRVNPAARFIMTDVKIDHYGYQPSIRELKDKTNRNIKLLNKELEENPDHGFHLYNIGIEYLVIGQTAKAYECFHKSRKLVAPSTNYAHLLYKCESRCLGALNKLQEAIDCCEEGIQLYPDYTDLHHFKGSYFMAMGNFPAAKTSLQRALSCYGKNHYHTEAGIGSHTTLYLLGLVCESQGEDDEAISYYIQCYRSSSTTFRPVYRAFQLLRSTGREKELFALILRTFKMQVKENREKMLEILLRTHCYQTAEKLIVWWLENGSWQGGETEYLKKVQSECQLMQSSKECGVHLDGRISPPLQELLKAEHPGTADLPDSLQPTLNESSLVSVLNTERTARILYSQGCTTAFYQFINKWKNQHKGMAKDFQTSSVLQLVQTLSYNAEEHLRMAGEGIKHLVCSVRRE